MVFPSFTTDRLLLNELTIDDSQMLFDLFSKAIVVKYYDLPVFTELSQASRLITLFDERFKQATGIRFAIRLKETGAFIGTCGFNHWSSAMKSGAIGYDLMPEYWGQGYIVEAVKGLLELAFNGALPCGKLHRIQADTVPGNKASESVLKKLGFVEEGVRRESGYWKGQYHNLTCFSLLSHEYQ